MSDIPLERLETTWKHLKKHNARQSLFLVFGIPLLEIAQAVVQDRKEWIAEVIQKEKMRRPTSEEVLEWETDPKWKDQRFPFVIVQPFVFVEPPIEDH